MGRFHQEAVAFRKWIKICNWNNFWLIRRFRIYSRLPILHHFLLDLVVFEVGELFSGLSIWWDWPLQRTALLRRHADVLTGVTRILANSFLSRWRHLTQLHVNNLIRDVRDPVLLVLKRYLPWLQNLWIIIYRLLRVEFLLFFGHFTLWNSLDAQISVLLTGEIWQPEVHFLVIIVLVDFAFRGYD